VKVRAFKRRLTGLTHSPSIQLFFFNEALRLTSSVISFPVVFCFFMVLSFLNGVVFFDQRLSTLQIIICAAGSVVIMLGVVMLSNPQLVPFVSESKPVEAKPLLNP